MSITFRCANCQKEVQAPDAAAGKRGKCPYCGHSSYIPSPVNEADLIPMAAVDEEEERRRAQRIKELLQQEHDLIAETGTQPAAPLEHQEDVAAEDLYHFVVNYCLDLATGKLDRAQTHVTELRKHGFAAQQAVQDFLGGRAEEPALDSIPKRVLQGFLTQLRDELK
jgi:phage FluMu protein Com